MRTFLDCIPCFYVQALKAARISGVNEEVQREVINHLSKLIPQFSLNITPAEMGREIYAIISKVTGKKDPYREIKEESNKMALKLYPQLKIKVKSAENQLLTAIKLAIIGNIIDYGIQRNLVEINEEINKMLVDNFDSLVSNNGSHFDYSAFCEHLLKIETILYLADNAGEVVFDRVLIEHLVDYYHKTVIYVVKGKPVLNDALVDDAIYCGINHSANIISCGADSPGVVLNYCSPEFIRIFNNTDMIISKGQGNFEALSGEGKPLFFLLIAKCPVVARHLGCHTGDFILENASKIKKLSVEVAGTKK